MVWLSYEGAQALDEFAESIGPALKLMNLSTEKMKNTYDKLKDNIAEQSDVVRDSLISAEKIIEEHDNVMLALAGSMKGKADDIRAFLDGEGGHGQPVKVLKLRPR